MNEATSSPVSAGRSVVVDAADVAVVIEARQLRQRLYSLRRVLRALLIFGFFGGCLTAIYLPSLPGGTCRSRQSEAKGNLKALYVAEESYRAEFDNYVDDSFERIGFRPLISGSRPARYRYIVTDVTDVTDGPRASFVAWAFATAPDHDGDVWRIDNNNRQLVVVNGCAR